MSSGQWAETNTGRGTLTDLPLLSSLPSSSVLSVHYSLTTDHYFCTPGPTHEDAPHRPAPAVSTPTASARCRGRRSCATCSPGATRCRAERFTAPLDDLVRFAIRLQEQAGLDVVSDGEWRRTQYIREFLRRVGGFERVRTFAHQGETKLTEVVVRRMTRGRAGLRRGRAASSSANTDRVTKFALPSPFLIAVRYWHEDHSRDAYPTLRALPRPPGRDPGPRGAGARGGGHRHRADRRPGPDLLLRPPADGRARQPRRAAAAGLGHRPAIPAGRRGDQPRRRGAAGRGPPALLPQRLQAAERRDAATTSRSCRGWPDAKVDRVNLEFAYPGTGDVERPGTAAGAPRRRHGRGRRARRTRCNRSRRSRRWRRPAARIVAPERIALNPDCGFAPDAGEPPTIDEAYEKLSRLVAAARNLRAKFAAQTG